MDFSLQGRGEQAIPEFGIPPQRGDACQGDRGGHTAASAARCFAGAMAAESARAADAYSGIGRQLPILNLYDEFAFGIVVIGADGEILYASRTASMQMQAGRGIREADGHVRASDPGDQPALNKAIEGAIAGRRGYLSIGRSGGRLDAAVLPLQVGGEDVAALVLEKAAGSNGLGLYFFSRAHGLTRSEQVILGHLCEGVTVIEVSRRVGSSVHTVRTHVRGILSKTGMPSLRSLVSRIGLLPPIGARFAIAHARDEALSQGGGSDQAPAAPARPSRLEVPFAGA